MLKSEAGLEGISPDNQINVVTIRKHLRFDGLKMSSKRGNNSDLSLGQISEAQLCSCSVSVMSGMVSDGEGLTS